MSFKKISWPEVLVAFFIVLVAAITVYSVWEHEKQKNDGVACQAYCNSVVLETDPMSEVSNGVCRCYMKVAVLPIGDIRK